MAQILPVLDHPATRCAVLAERALLARLDAGCQTPIAALARIEDGALRLDAAVVSVDGSESVRISETGDQNDPVELGYRVAGELLDSPAGKLLDEVRREADLKGIGAAG